MGRSAGCSRSRRQSGTSSADRRRRRDEVREGRVRVGRSSQRKRSRQKSNARRRQQSSARSRAVAKPPASASTSGYSPAIENTMFFVRLRKGSKWVFIAVIFAFAFTFLFAGVGSGSGSGDIIQELLGMRGGSDPVKVAEKNIAQHPHNASALVPLAQAHDATPGRVEAVNAYTKYSKIKPKDTGALVHLGRLQE